MEDERPSHWALKVSEAIGAPAVSSPAAQKIRLSKCIRQWQGLGPRAFRLPAWDSESLTEAQPHSPAPAGAG